MTTYKQERVGDYITTYSGKNFYPLDPRSEDIDIEDIAHSLSNLCRFTGHGKRFYSVGEHSLHCAMVARDEGFTILEQLYCLLHDSSEAIVNDLARPVKQNIEQYKEIEDKIMSVMWDVFRIPQPSDEDYKIVKLIDNTLLVNEMKQLMNRHDEEFPEIEHIEVKHVDMSNEPGNKDVKDAFLLAYYALMTQYKEEYNEG